MQTLLGIRLNRYFALTKRKLELAFQELQNEFSELLRQHVKKSHTKKLLEKRSTKDYFYTLDFSANKESPYSNPYSQLGWQTNFGFVLSATRLSQLNIPVAIVGFEIRGNCVIIRQLNNTDSPYSQESLQPIKWERLLCKSVAFFAHSLNISLASICSINSQHNSLLNRDPLEKLNRMVMAKNLNLYLRYYNIFQKNEFEWNNLEQMYTFRILL